MVPAGMPELQTNEPIGYLKEKLLLGLSEEEARDQFEKEILNSLYTKTRTFDNVIHMWKHNDDQ